MLNYQICLKIYQTNVVGQELTSVQSHNIDSHKAELKVRFPSCVKLAMCCLLDGQRKTLLIVFQTAFLMCPVCVTVAPETVANVAS